MLDAERQFDQHGAHVVDHGHQHAAQAFGLFRTPGRGLETAADQRRNVGRQPGNRGTEALLEVGRLEQVRQIHGHEQGRDQRLPIHVEVAQDLRHVQWMGLETGGIDGFQGAIQRLGQLQAGGVVLGLVAREMAQ